MRVAIISEDLSLQNFIRGVLKRYEWQVDFFQDSSDFGKVDLDPFDIIVADYKLSKITGRDLLRTIACKTPAQMVLLGTEFTDADINSDWIKGLIDRTKPEALIDYLEYLEIKLRVSRIMEQERDKFDLFSPTQTYQITIKDSAALLEIQDILTETDRLDIIKFIDENPVQGVIVFFKKDNHITSPYLGVLVSLYKLFRKRKEKLIFLDTKEKSYVTTQIRTYELAKCFPIFRDLSQALEYTKVGDSVLIQ